MTFKKILFILLNGFIVCSCALQIGEEPLGEPAFYLPTPSSACSQLDYEEVFLDYFFADAPSRDKVNQALSCISVKIDELKRLIGHEFLNKQQTVNILQQDFIQKSPVKDIVNNILKPEYFDNYISIKDNLLNLLQPDLKRDYLRPDWICHIKPNEDKIISKESADDLIYFLDPLSKLFSSAEESAYDLFEGFFKGRSIRKTDLQTSKEVWTEFSSFLSDYLSQTFPSYSQFLKKQIEESPPQAVRFKKRDYQGNHLMIESLDEKTIPLQSTISPLLKMLDLPLSGESEITAKNLKYMMLNIYIMQAFFNIYDLNQDFVLSSQELKSLSCLMTPLVSILVSSKLKDRLEIIQETYDSKVIANYIINYKKLPPEGLSFKGLFEKNIWRFLWFRMTFSDNLHQQSYTEVSELISMLFLEFFNKIQFEES